jgi:hypothetical protein
MAVAPSSALSAAAIGAHLFSAVAYFGKVVAFVCVVVVVAVAAAVVTTLLVPHARHLFFFGFV